MEDAPKSSANDPKAAEPLRERSERLGPKLEEAQARLTEANERIKRFIRDNPGSCLVGAAVLGFVVGRWASRHD
jgi:hypothetical protein